MQRTETPTCYSLETLGALAFYGLDGSRQSQAEMHAIFDHFLTQIEQISMVDVGDLPYVQMLIRGSQPETARIHASAVRKDLQLLQIECPQKYSRSCLSSTFAIDGAMS